MPANLAENLSYWFVDRFLRWHMSTIIDFLLDGRYNAWPVQILENHHLCSIQ